MPRGRKRGSTNFAKLQAKRDFSNRSQFNMSRISSLDSHVTFQPQISEMDIDNSDSISIEEQIAMMPRREIKFNDYADSVINLKVQERIDVEQEDDQIYYVTQSQKTYNYDNAKLEKENRYKLTDLIFQKLDFDYKKRNPLQAKALYRVKRQTPVEVSITDFSVSSAPRKIQQREILQICD